MIHSELLRAADEILAVIGDKPSHKLGVEELAKVFAIACNVLTSVLDPQSIARDLEYLGRLTAEDRKEVHDVLGSIDEFAKFLRFEERLLVDARTNPVTCGRLLQIVESVRTESTRNVPNRDELLRDIRNLRVVVCKMSADLATEFERAQTVNKAQGMVMGATKAVLGVTVIAANASAAAQTLGLSTVSVILGWEPIKSFLKRFW